ncbi:DUF397 domain-containing protein [Actinoallomurus iriomotensis]|uniref:DUF397 domain-containing protein n=1 Tax=Actinoallomurus iriomotensis TaxID=478107 RepID=A0A9W6S4E8_9ACTN|nr:DUF397 domain-containing protein [Actinoallomurus iriomotensis]GLY88406.1 hypothetical protein Airi02_063350 [Actinoallomurus iriomotensis]
MSEAMERMMLEAAEFHSACSVGGCVEVAITEVVAVRDSKAGPDGPVLWFTRAEWKDFVAAVQTGQFAID